MLIAAAISPVDREELLRVAAEVFWWGSPEEHLANLKRFVAQVMTFGDWESVTTTRRVLGDECFREVLQDVPPGVFDQKSWHYWHNYFGITAGDLPTRKL